jgi:hypothetical protein
MRHERLPARRCGEFPEPLQVRWQLSGLLAPSILLPAGCGSDFVPRHGTAARCSHRRFQ